MAITPTFPLGPPPPRDDPRFDQWATQMWEYLKYIAVNGGSVTSVAQSVPSIMSVSGSPITTTGTLAIALSTQTANTVFSGPTTGAAATPTFRSLVAADLPAGTGTVTSVGLVLPTGVFDVAGSPVTTSGDITVTFDTQTANTAFMGPTSGGAATPAFRALVAADIPSSFITIAQVAARVSVHL